MRFLISLFNNVTYPKFEKFPEIMIKQLVLFISNYWTVFRSSTSVLVYS